MTDTPTRVSQPSPLFAVHSRDVLREAGLTDETIDSLVASETVVVTE